MMGVNFSTVDRYTDGKKACREVLSRRGEVGREGWREALSRVLDRVRTDPYCQ